MTMKKTARSKNDAGERRRSVGRSKKDIGKRSEAVEAAGAPKLPGLILWIRPPTQMLPKEIGPAG